MYGGMSKRKPMMYGGMATTKKKKARQEGSSGWHDDRNTGSAESDAKSNHAEAEDADDGRCAMTMVEMNGRMVPDYAADGKGKNDLRKKMNEGGEAKLSDADKKRVERLMSLKALKNSQR